MNKTAGLKLKNLIKEHRMLDWEIKKLQALRPYKDDEIKVLKNDNRQTV